MAHIQIRSPHPDGGIGTYQLLVNDTDLSMDALAEPFHLEFPPEPWEPARLIIALEADNGLDIDLPDAVLHALAIDVSRARETP